MAFQEVDIQTLSFNPFDKIGRQWMLITAGDSMKSNTMTASWGGVGIMWGKPVVTAYIRPQRYTKEFVDGNDRFTISFLPEDEREALNICGSVSGRDAADKWEQAGLHPYLIDEKTLEETAAVEEAPGRESAAVWIKKSRFQAPGRRARPAAYIPPRVRRARSRRRVRLRLKQARAAHRIPPSALRPVRRSFRACIREARTLPKDLA